MKKFLLLIVGVLFALSANANWTFYVDISGTDWTEAPYFYAGHGEKFYEAKQCLTTPVKEKIYQVTFDGWDDLVELYICKRKLVNTECTKAQIEEAGTQNVDWFGKFATNAGNAQYGFNSDNKNTPLFKLTKGTGGASITVNYDPTDVVYKYSGDETSWNNNNGEKELELSANGDGTYSLTRTFANSKNFGIREYTNGSETAWYYGVTGSNTISTVGQTYNAVTSDGSNWNFQLTEGKYTLTFNPSEKTIVFTSTSDPDPTDEYVYKLHTDLVNGSWNTYDMFKQADGTWAWAGQLYLTGSEQAFGIKKVKGTSEAEIWCISKSDTDYTLSDGSKVGAVIKDGENGHDFKISEAGFYQIVLDPTKEDNMTVTLTKLDSELEFTYAVHGNIVGGDWKDSKMGKVPGSNWWYLEGKFQSGEFGIKKLDKNGDQYVYEGHNEWGWIHSLENAAITLGTWNKAVVKGYYPDTDPNTKGVGNWKLSGLATGTKYTIMFDAEHMQILVSPVAASGVEDINVDEDAPVEYFNLQGQRVNGELTPGIYIRRQGSTVTKVRF